MPVSFLTPDQIAQYGCYQDPPDATQLEQYFYLDETDRAFLANLQGDHNRLGCAIQICNARFLGTFVEDVTTVPAVVIDTLAAQLVVDDPACLTTYRTSDQRWRHTARIRERYGYRTFHEQPGHFQLVRWLATRAWVKAERPIVLFDMATTWLADHNILLPGATVLERLVSSVRDRMAARLWRHLTIALTDEHRTKLAALLAVPTGRRTSLLDILRDPPTRTTAPALVEALARYATIRDLGVGTIDLRHIPRTRLKELARYAAGSRAQTIERLDEDRRWATLFAFARVYEATAQDDAITILDQLIDDLLSKAKKVEGQARLRTIKDLDAAAVALSEATAMLLDDTTPDAVLRTEVFAKVSREHLQQAIQTVQTMTRPPDNSHYQDLVARYGHVRRFLPTLLRTITWHGSVAGQPVLDAWAYLQAAEGQRKPNLLAAPRTVLTKTWERYVGKSGDEVDLRYYTFCVLEQLQRRLDRRDVFITPSDQWSDPRAKLLQGTDWESARPQICRTLQRSLTPAPDLAQFAERLDAMYRRVAANLPTNTAVTVTERVDGVDINLQHLDKLEEPASLVALRADVSALLPHVDLAEVLLEIQAVTHFAEEFTHISERGTRVTDFPLSLCAVLLADACNLPLESVARADIPALTRDRLAWVRHNYVRIETLRRGNARLVEYQTTIPLAQQWGGGDVASADGLRFVVPVRTIHAGKNAKYFPGSRGLTLYSLLSDQFTGLHDAILPGTLAEGPALLACVVEQQTSLRPVTIMTDTRAYSDVLFGIFALLGRQFSPRLTGLGELRFWRVDPAADYGPLNRLARHQIDLQVITDHWDDLLRLVGSLTMGTIDAWEMLRLLQGENRATTLARAVSMVGRMAKTQHMLAFLDSEVYRRGILTQLNRGEGRHSVARAVYHGQKGEMRRRYRTGQEDQLGALGFVLNVLVLWNTRYMQVALQHLQQQGVACAEGDVARLSPHGFEHIHLTGRHAFVLDETVRQGALRPLTKPR